MTTPLEDDNTIRPSEDALACARTLQTVGALAPVFDLEAQVKGVALLIDAYVRPDLRPRNDSSYELPDGALEDSR